MLYNILHTLYNVGILHITCNIIYIKRFIRIINDYFSTKRQIILDDDNIAFKPEIT